MNMKFFFSLLHGIGSFLRYCCKKVATITDDGNTTVSRRFLLAFSLVLTRPVLRASILTSLAIISVLLPRTALAESCALPQNYQADVRPDPEGTPTVVRFGLLVADVTGIDDVDQAIEGDFIIKKTWRDPRLTGLDGCRFQRAQVWFPITDVLNSSQLQRSRGVFANDQVKVDSSGLVQYHQRFFGKIATYHQLQEFPFDKHRMPLRVAALEFPVDQLKIELDEEFGGLAELLNIPDWRIDGVEASVVEAEITEFDNTYSVAIFEVLAERNTNFYIYKVLVPLALIVTISFTVFWVNPERFGPQIGLSATAMLTLIAFQFSLTAVLPRLGYFTVMDRLIFGSTVLVFLALVQATVTTALVSYDRVALAQRLDRICRWLFPLAFSVLWLAVFA